MTFNVDIWQWWFISSLDPIDVRLICEGHRSNIKVTGRNSSTG